jgi:hypothetical protein
MSKKPVPAAKNTSGSNEYYDPSDVNKEIDRMVKLAVEAASKGEDVTQLQEVMSSSLPAKMREELKKRFAAALHAKKIKAPSTDADVAPRNVLSRIRKIFMESARQAMQRVANLMKAKPSLATQVKQIGQALTKSGVALDKNAQVTEVDLGMISPTAGIGTRTVQAGGKGITGN